MAVERPDADGGSGRGPDASETDVASRSDRPANGDPTADADATEPPADTAPDCYCPASGIVEALGRKYAIQVVCVVGAHGTARFSDVESALPGASTSTLSARLSELEDEGVVARTQYDEIPPRVEYALTDDGRELQARLEPLVEWARERA